MERIIAALIAARARGSPDRPAYVFGGKTVTWAQYEARSEQCARYLARLGFQPGERLAVLLPNGPGVHIAWVAAEKAGLVIVALSDRTGFQELEHALRLTGASGLISRAQHLGSSVSDFLRELRSRGCAIRHHLAVDGELEEDEPILLDGTPVDVGLPGAPVPHERHLAADDLFLLKRRHRPTEGQVDNMTLW